MAGVVFDIAGNLYGTTMGGGNDGGYPGCGVVYKLTPNSNGRWSESILHTFATSTDGANPGSGLLLDNLGNVYGTTPSGGLGEPSADGIVYEIIQ